MSAEAARRVSERPRLIVDCAGGDHGVVVAVPAALRFAPQVDLILVGDKAAIARFPLPQTGVRVVHAPENASMDAGIRKLLRSTSVTAQGRCLSLLQSGAGDVLVSAADTSALLILARHELGALPGIDRPAITKQLIGKAGSFWMADLGANVRCTPQLLVQFAQMGVVAARTFSGIERPRVALLNIGTEASKGLARLHRAGEALALLPDASYVGFVEGSALFDNQADVIVCEGFVGNVALKAIEGTAGMARHLMGEALGSLPVWQRPLLWALRSALTQLGERLDTGRYNGAPILGLNHTVIKSHGAAGVDAFAFALQRGIDAISLALPSTLASGLNIDAGAQH